MCYIFEMESRYNFYDCFKGDLTLLSETFNKSVRVAYVTDGDGIKFDTSNPVLNRVFETTGVRLRPSEIDSWNYVYTSLLRKGLDEQTSRAANNLWYDPEILKKGRRYQYSMPTLNFAQNYYDNAVYLLTARLPELREATEYSLKKLYPDFPVKNLLIREVGSRLNSEAFKAESLDALAARFDWVIFIDDFEQNIRAALASDMRSNILGLGVPLGKTVYNFEHPRLILYRRFPFTQQGIYPVLDSMRRAQALAFNLIVSHNVDKTNDL